MLRACYKKGFSSRLTRYVKTADWRESTLNAGKGMLHFAFGHPLETGKQILNNTAFKPNGILAFDNVLWPKIPGPEMVELSKALGRKLETDVGGLAKGTKLTKQHLEDLKALKTRNLHVSVSPTKMDTAGAYINRAFNVGVPLMSIYSILRGDGDPNEGTLSNVLGSLGSNAGFMYGFPAAGFLGAPILSNLGRHAGNTVGRLLGSRPKNTATPDLETQDSNYLQTQGRDYWT